MSIKTQKQIGEDQTKTSEKSEAAERSREFADKVERKEKAQNFIEKIGKEIKKPQISEVKDMTSKEIQNNAIKLTREKFYQYQLNNLSLSDNLYEDRLYLKSLSFDEYTSLSEVSRFYKRDFTNFLKNIETMKNPGLDELNKMVKINEYLDDWCQDENSDLARKEKEEKKLEQKGAEESKSDGATWLSRSWSKIIDYFGGSTTDEYDYWGRESETESFKRVKNEVEKRCEDIRDKILSAKMKEIDDSSRELADSLFEGKIIHNKNLQEYITKSLAYSYVLPIRKTTDQIFKFGYVSGESKLRSWEMQDYYAKKKNAVDYHGRVVNDDDALIDWTENRETLRKTLNHQDFNTIDKKIYRDYTAYTPRENHALMLKLLELEKPIDGDTKNQFELAKKFTKNQKIKEMIDEQEKKGILKDKKFANEVTYVEAKRLFNSDKQLKNYGIEQYEKDLTAITAHLTGLDDQGRENEVKKIDDIYKTDTFNRSKLVKQEFVKSLMKTKEIDRPMYKKMFELTNVNKKDIKQLLKNINKLTIYRKLNHIEPIVNINSMSELSDELDKRNIKEISDIFGYTPEEQSLVKEKLEKLEKEFEIVTQLASRYKENGFGEQNRVLGQLFIKIAKGGDSFSEWKYSAKNLESQLSGMTDDQKKAWMTDSVLKKEYLGEQSNQKTEKIATIKSLVDIFPSEINFQLNPNEKINFTADEWDKYKKQRDLLQTKIAQSKGKDVDAKKQKTLLDNKLRILDFYFMCKDLDDDNFDASNLKLRINKLESNFKKMGLDPNALNGLRTILDEDLKKTDYYEAKETSNYFELLNVGVNPIESCQSWRDGRYNENLLAYVVDGNKKIIQVRDGNNDLLARSVIKLVSHQDHKVILPERIYTRVDNYDMRKLFIETFLVKAKNCNNSIILSNEWLKEYKTEGLKDFTVNDLRKVAEKQGYSVKEIFKAEIKLPESNNKIEYSDVLNAHQIINFSENYEVTETTGKNFLLEKKQI